MHKIKVLDCTMRDGGWVNGFAFGTEHMRDILKTEEGAGIEFCELGYLDKDKGSYREKTMYANFQALAEGFSGVKRRGNTVRLVMIDCGKFEAEQLPRCTDRQTSVIDGIRLCFHKKDIEKAVSFGKRILDRGYLLFVQPMVNSRYSDDDLKELMENVQRELQGFSAFYIVDSFGVMREENVRSRLLLADSYLDPGVMLGMHTHNNLNLCMEHAKTACSIVGSGAEGEVLHRERTLILDCTLGGLGKGPGNLVTEDITSYLVQNFKKEYDTEAIKKLSERVTEPLRKVYSWGYMPEYALCSKYAATSTYAKTFCKEHKRSLQELETFLATMPENKKDSFDKKFAEEYLRKMNR